ncbi:MAG: hypothetical protein ABIG68_00455, partial [Acidobacteriota bacterium]
MIAEHLPGKGTADPHLVQEGAADIGQRLRGNACLNGQTLTPSMYILVQAMIPHPHKPQIQESRT